MNRFSLEESVFIVRMHYKFGECFPETNLNILTNVGSNFLENIIRMDETPVSLYVSESRRKYIK